MLFIIKEFDGTFKLHDYLGCSITVIHNNSKFQYKMFNYNAFTIIFYVDKFGFLNLQSFNKYWANKNFCNT